MLGFFVCLGCNTIHDDWFHGDRLLVCNRCKSKESVRYKSPTRSFIHNGVEMISWTLNPSLYDMIRTHVSCNPFDIAEVKRQCVRPPELFIEICKDIDSYIKFAYHDFYDPQTIYNRYLMRNPNKKV